MPDLQKSIDAMDRACRIWSVGYDQGNRWDVRDGGETDCSALVIWALRQGGFDTGGATYTGNMSAALTARGWRRLRPSLSTVRPGDILLNDTHHVCMVVRGHGLDATVAQASIDERSRASGGRSGDQTGGETNERRVYVYRHGWDCILRWQGSSVEKPKAKSAPVMGDDREDEMGIIYEPRNKAGKALGFQALLEGGVITTLTKSSQSAVLAKHGRKVEAVSEDEWKTLCEVFPVRVAKK